MSQQYGEGRTVGFDQKLKWFEYGVFSMAVAFSSGLVLFCMTHGEDIKSAFGV